jgi:hypothetical protein
MLQIGPFPMAQNNKKGNKDFYLKSDKNHFGLMEL